MPIAERQPAQPRTVRCDEEQHWVGEKGGDVGGRELSPARWQACIRRIIGERRRAPPSLMRFVDHTRWSQERDADG